MRGCVTALLLGVLQILLAVSAQPTPAPLPTSSANVTDGCARVRAESSQAHKLFRPPAAGDLLACNRSTTSGMSSVFQSCAVRLESCRRQQPANCTHVFFQCPLEYVWCVERRIQIAVDRERVTLCPYEANVHLELLAFLSGGGILPSACVASLCVDDEVWANASHHSSSSSSCSWPDTTQMLTYCSRIAVITGTATHHVTQSTTITIDRNSTSVTATVAPTRSESKSLTFVPPTRAPRTPAPTTGSPTDAPTTAPPATDAPTSIPSTPSPNPTTRPRTHTATVRKARPPTLATPSRTPVLTVTHSAQTESMTASVSTTESLQQTALDVTPTSIVARDLVADDIELSVLLKGDRVLPYIAVDNASLVSLRSCFVVTVVRRAGSGSVGWRDCAPQILVSSLTNRTRFNLLVARCEVLALAASETVEIRLLGECTETNRDSVGNLVIEPSPPTEVVGAAARVAMSAVGYAAALVAMGIGGAAPSLGLLAQRTNALLTIAECRPVFNVEISFWQYPFQAAVGSDQRVEKAFGGALLNPLLLAAIHLLHWLAVVFVGASRHRARSSATFAASRAANERWAAMLKFPAVGAAAFMYLLVPSLMMSAFSLRHAESSSILVFVFASLAFAGWFIGVVFVSVEILRRFRASWEETNPKLQTFADRLIKGPGKWVDTPGVGEGYVRRFGAFFAPLRPRRVWFSAAEFSVSIAFALIEGFRPEHDCDAAAFALAAVACLFFVAVLVGLPYAAPLHQSFVVLVSGLHLAAAVVIVLHNQGRVSNLDIVGICVVSVFGAFLFRLVVDLAMFVHNRFLAGPQLLLLRTPESRRKAAAIPTASAVRFDAEDDDEMLQVASGSPPLNPTARIPSNRLQELFNDVVDADRRSNPLPERPKSMSPLRVPPAFRAFFDDDGGDDVLNDDNDDHSPTRGMAPLPLDDHVSEQFGSSRRLSADPGVYSLPPLHSTSPRQPTPLQPAAITAGGLSSNDPTVAAARMRSLNVDEMLRTLWDDDGDTQSEKEKETQQSRRSTPTSSSDSEVDLERMRTAKNGGGETGKRNGAPAAAATSPDPGKPPLLPKREVREKRQASPSLLRDMLEEHWRDVESAPSVAQGTRQMPLGRPPLPETPEEAKQRVRRNEIASLRLFDFDVAPPPPPPRIDDPDESGDSLPSYDSDL